MELTKCFRCFMPEIFEIIDNCLLLHSQKYPFFGGGEGGDEVGDAVEAMSASEGGGIIPKAIYTKLMADMSFQRQNFH